VDDESGFQGLPDSKPDEGVAVDHQAVWGLAQDCFPYRSWTSRAPGGFRGSRAPILPSRGVR
jgi:hypothetical protein